jgi:hypothetical protein
MAENTENIDENPVEDASAPVVDEAQGDKRHRDEPNREEEPGEQQGQRGDAVTQQPEGDAEASDSGEGSEPSDESVSDDAQGDQGDSGQQRCKRRRQGNQANNNGQVRG